MSAVVKASNADGGEFSENVYGHQGILMGNQWSLADISTERQFIKDIIANPADDIPRLIYADWLSDHDDERGDWIRAQVALYDVVVRNGISGGPEYATVMRSSRETTTEYVLRYVSGVEVRLGELGASGLASEQTALDVVSVVPGGRRGSGITPTIRWRRGFPAGCSVNLTGDFLIAADSTDRQRTASFLFSWASGRINTLRSVMPLEGLLLLFPNFAFPSSSASGWLYGDPDRRSGITGELPWLGLITESLRGVPEIDLSMLRTDNIYLIRKLSSGSKKVKLPGAPLTRIWANEHEYRSRPISLNRFSRLVVQDMLGYLVSAGVEAISFGKQLEYRFSDQTVAGDQASEWEERTVRDIPIGLMHRNWVPLDVQ